jgi:hypothetical protein
LASALSGVTGRDRLIDCIDRLLHQQSGQLQGSSTLMHP